MYFLSVYDWHQLNKRRRRTTPYAFEVHHKPEHDTEKPTPIKG